MVTRLLLIGASVWLAASVAQAIKPDHPEREKTAGADVKVMRLEEIDARLTTLQKKETTLRDQWEPRHRAASREKQMLFKQDKDVRAIQQEITQHLEQVRALQEKLNQLLSERTTDPNDDRPDADALQRQIVELRRERQELLRERQQLQRSKIRSRPDTGAADSKGKNP